mmetsp:Transcript_119504/g.385834  ORF Transcript_119504/g.385834 Transcript_119504/m.385834 type:complete len:215 (-) Transcript_119504:844-1488(-)
MRSRNLPNDVSTHSSHSGSVFSESSCGSLSGSSPGKVPPDCRSSSVSCSTRCEISRTSGCNCWISSRCALQASRLSAMESSAACSCFWRSESASCFVCLLCVSILPRASSSSRRSLRWPSRTSISRFMWFTYVRSEKFRLSRLTKILTISSMFEMPVLFLIVANACSKTSMLFRCCLICRRWMQFRKAVFMIRLIMPASEKPLSSSGTMSSFFF